MGPGRFTSLSASQNSSRGEFCLEITPKQNTPLKIFTALITHCIALYQDAFKKRKSYALTHLPISIGKKKTKQNKNNSYKTIKNDGFFLMN